MNLLVLALLSLCGYAADRPFARTCAEYFERLSNVDEIARHLEDHHARVRANLSEDIVGPEDRPRGMRVSDALQRRYASDLLDWVGARANGATLFHGSSSPVLMAFAPPGGHGLLPNAILIERLGLAPLTGVLDAVSNDPWVLNMVGLNVVGTSELGQTFEYGEHDRSEPAQWPGMIKVMAEDGAEPYAYTSELLRARLEVVRSFTAEDPWYLTARFPLVLGFASRPDAIVWLAGGPLGSHLVMASNLSPAELRLVLTPRAFVERTRRFFEAAMPSESVSVQPLEPVRALETAVARKLRHHYDVYPSHDFVGLDDREFAAYLDRIARRRR